MAAGAGIEVACGRGVWEAVVAANSVIMSVFLWHLTALLVAVVVLFPLGFPQPAGGTASWWAWRPAWIFVLLAFLVPFVAAFSRFERPGPKKTQRRALPTARTMTGVCFLVMGLSGLAQYGFRITGDTGDSIALVPVASAVLAIAGHRLSLPRPGGAR